MPDFLLPDLGEGLTDAAIVAWQVAPGDTVAVDQAVVEVETAKAVVEVPVPFAGVVTRLHAEPGDRVLVGQPLISVAASEEKDSAGSGAVLIGYGTSETGPGRRRRAVVAAGSPTPAPTPVPTVAPAAAPVTSAATATTPLRSGPIAVVSPLVRKLALDAGLNLAQLTGTGKDGLIVRRDVDAALARTAARSTTSLPASSSRGEDGTDSPGVHRVPLTGLRRATADKLSRSRREIPEATVWVDVDATELLALRRRLNADESLPRVSLLALLARIVVAGLRRYPELNATIEGEDILLHDSVDLGIATNTDRGLMVPVIRGAGALSLDDLNSCLAATTERARAGSLTPSELRGGTVTLNNYGVFGVDGSAAIINHPEVAIIGIGRIIERPWVVDGALAVRSVTEITLAFDHRACDGGVAGGLLRFIADHIENPSLLLRGA